MIGDEVTATVLEVKGDQVRIGVTAPKAVAVHREEIHQRIKAEKKRLKVPAFDDGPYVSRNTAPQRSK